MRLALFRLALIVMTFLLTVGMGELFVRLVAAQPVSWLAIYRSHPDLPFFSMLPNTLLHIDTGETEWTVATDEDGFRVPLTPRPKAECTALWLGDSFAFGHGVEYAESFIGLIEERTVGVEHRNSAVPGYGPAQYRKTLEYLDGRGLDFDWVFVASYVGNDFHDTQWEKDSSAVDGILGNQGGLKSFLKRNFHVYRLVSATYHALAEGDQKGHDAVIQQLTRPGAWEEEFLATASRRYASEMRRIQELATGEGKPVVFLILPTRDAAARTFEIRSAAAAQEPTTEPSERQPMFPVERARAILDEIGARYIDLTPVVGAFPADEMFFRFDGHLTPEGNERVAEEFVRQFGAGLRCDRDTGRSPGERSEARAF